MLVFIHLSFCSSKSPHPIAVVVIIIYKYDPHIFCTLGRFESHIKWSQVLGEYKDKSVHKPNYNFHIALKKSIELVQATIWINLLV